MTGPWFPPAGEVAYFLPATDAKFFSLGIWSERTRCWVPLLFTANREAAAGHAARLTDGGFFYWAIPFDVDDEAGEVAAWRTVPPPDSPEFHAMIGRGFHSEGDPNA